MVYIVEFWVSGGCRTGGIGYTGAIGAAAVTMVRRDGSDSSRVRYLPGYPVPTSPRAQLTAVIMALEWGLEDYCRQSDQTRLSGLRITINAVDLNAVLTMREWRDSWSKQYNWMTYAGGDVKNQDLIRRAGELHDELMMLGLVHYWKVSKNQNQHEGRLCHQAMDKLEERLRHEQLRQDLRRAKIDEGLSARSYGSAPTSWW